MPKTKRGVLQQAIVDWKKRKSDCDDMYAQGSAMQQESEQMAISATKTLFDDILAHLMLDINHTTVNHGNKRAIVTGIRKESHRGNGVSAITIWGKPLDDKYSEEILLSTYLLDIRNNSFSFKSGIPFLPPDDEETAIPEQECAFKTFKTCLPLSVRVADELSINEDCNKCYFGLNATRNTPGCNDYVEFHGMDSCREVRNKALAMNMALKEELDASDE